MRGALSGSPCQGPEGCQQGDLSSIPVSRLGYYIDDVGVRFFAVAKILFVEDDQTLSTTVVDWLSGERHVVEHVADGTASLDFIKAYPYDLIILDWQLPGWSGVEICQEVRKIGLHTPVLMLTAKNQVQDKSAGLDAGADDYLTKPFHMQELSARVRALLRRQPLVQQNTLAAGDLILDRAAGKVTRNGEEIHLVPKEFALLEFFMRHPNQVFSAETIIARVWPAESEASTQSLRPYINRLRGKIESSERSPLIRTVHGMGYKLEVQED